MDDAAATPYIGIAQQVLTAKSDNARWKGSWAPHAEYLYPLTNKVSRSNITKRKRIPVAGLGKGTYGEVHLEKLKIASLKDQRAIVATKYFRNLDSFGFNINEIAVLKYLKNQPNVAQLIGLAETEPTENQGPYRFFSPSKPPKPLQFPAVVMAAADKSLSDRGAVFTTWDILYNIIKGVLRGYNVMHSMGIVHRDVKPENMLITRSGEPWITDFGLSRYIAPNISPLHIHCAGTLTWLSPELLTKCLLYEGGKDTPPYDWKAADAWSVGLCLIYFVTGKMYQEQKPIYYYERKKLVEDLLESIFSKKGLPSVGDGEIYNLLEDKSIYKKDTILEYFSKKLQNIDKRNALTPRRFMEQYSQFIMPKPDDTQFEKVCAIIEGLTIYNPQERMTIKQALGILGENTDTTPIPLISTTCDGFFRRDRYEHIVNEIYKYNFELGNNKYIILDRTFTYIYKFANYLKSNVYEANKDIIYESTGMAYMIAVGLFLSIKKVDIVYNNIEPHQKEILNKIITNCDLLGKTWLDEMCEKEPAKINELGHLNLLCFEFMLYNEYKDRIQDLQTVLISISKEITIMEKLIISTDKPTIVTKIRDAMTKPQTAGQSQRYKASRRRTRRYHVKSRRLYSSPR